MESCGFFYWKELRTVRRLSTPLPFDCFAAQGTGLVEAKHLRDSQSEKLTGQIDTDENS